MPATSYLPQPTRPPNRPVGRAATSVVAALLAAAGLPTSAFGDIQWNGGSGNWSDPTRWTPNGTPNFATVVQIGSHAGAHDSIVTLDASGIIEALEITDGMVLDTNGSWLGTIFDTVVSGLNDPPGPFISPSQLWINGTSGMPAWDFHTANLTVSGGARVRLRDGGRLEVAAQLTNHEGSTISGEGTINLLRNELVSFVNSGILDPVGENGITINQFGSGPIDLDGFTGTGEVRLGRELSGVEGYDSLTVHGTRLLDTFSGQITLITGGLLNMDLSEGWTADIASTIEITGGGAATPARIQGGEFRLHGNFIVGGSAGHVRIDADTTVSPDADIVVATNGTLDFHGETVVNGGEFISAEDGNLVFSGPTTIKGGTFTTHSQHPFDGAVNFDGDTEWRADVTINGAASMNGDATVAAPTVINATLLDMDGNGSSVWDVNHTLVVNTDRVDDLFQQFDGTFNIQAGFAGRLTINLPDPAMAWRMQGTMNLAGSGAIPVTRVAGSKVFVTGELNVSSGIAQITADTAFSTQQVAANVSIQGGSTLRMRGVTSVGTNTNFAGTGTLQNGVNGVMELLPGVSLGQVGLTNNSVLHIGAGTAGIASVDRFTSTADALWNVDIGGPIAGTQHDLVLVGSGATVLGGTLDVSLIGLGGGAIFAPSVGDQFTILLSLSGVSGTFTNDPVTQINGLTYDWTVLYNSHSVVLRLDSVVPAPGTAALLGAALLLAGRRQRSALS